MTSSSSDSGVVDAEAGEVQGLEVKKDGGKTIRTEFQRETEELLLRNLKDMVAKLMMQQQPESTKEVNDVGGWQQKNGQVAQQPYKPPHAREDKNDMAQIKESLGYLSNSVKDLVSAMTKQNEKVDRHDGEINELTQHIKQIVQTLNEQKEANERSRISVVTILHEDEREKEQKNISFKRAADSYADPIDLICADPTEFYGKSIGTAHRNSSGTAYESEEKNKSANSEFLLPSTLQVADPKMHTHKDRALTATNDDVYERKDRKEGKTRAAREGAELACRNDSGAFTLKCEVGKHSIPHCLVDLGAAVNIMPLSIYSSLNLGPLKPPKILLEFADTSSARPVGLLEGLTLRVGDISVSADLYVLQMGDSRHKRPPSLILGRPFLEATRAKIDVAAGKLVLANEGRSCTFYMQEDGHQRTEKKPPDGVSSLRPEKASAKMVKVADRGGSKPTFKGARGRTGEQCWKNQPPDAVRGGGYVLSDERTILMSPELREGRVVGKFDHTFPWDPNW